jgi:hypothetical protein
MMGAGDCNYLQFKPHTLRHGADGIVRGQVNTATDAVRCRPGRGPRSLPCQQGGFHDGVNNLTSLRLILTVPAPFSTVLCFHHN